MMALLMGRGLRIISEVSGCSEKFRNSVQVRCRRKAPFFFSPSSLSISLAFLVTVLLRCGTLTAPLVLYIASSFNVGKMGWVF